MDLRSRRVWITGASSGIGEALAYELSQRGARLVLSSREVRERCVRPGDHIVQTLDLAAPDTLRQAAETVHDDGIGVTLACPGFVKTNVASNALYPDGTPLGDEAEEKGIPPDQCAAAIADAIEQNTAEFTVGGWETIAVYLKRFVPSLFRRMIRQYYGA